LVHYTSSVGSHAAPALSRAFLAGIGNQATPTPDIKRRGRNKPYPAGIRRTLLPCSQSSITNVIYNLRKKIEPDSRKPTYIKTVLGMATSLLPGNDNRITAATSGNVKAGNQEKVSCFFAPFFCILGKRQYYSAERNLKKSGWALPFFPCSV